MHTLIDSLKIDFQVLERLFVSGLKISFPTLSIITPDKKC